jgi:hypothetical protein
MFWFVDGILVTWEWTWGVGTHDIEIFRQVDDEKLLHIVSDTRQHVSRVQRAFAALAIGTVFSELSCKPMMSYLSPPGSSIGLTKWTKCPLVGI